MSVMTKPTALLSGGSKREETEKVVGYLYFHDKNDVVYLALQTEISDPIHTTIATNCLMMINQFHLAETEMKEVSNRQK